MRIKEIQLTKKDAYDDGKIVIIGENGAYVVTAKQIEDLLIEDGQMCDTCGDSGEITVDEQVYPGEPHMAPIGTKPCPNCIGKQDE